MTDPAKIAERIARGHRAKAALDEFIAPMVDQMDAEYTARIVEVANTELFFWRRTAKMTRLSDMLRMVRLLRSGLDELVRDGDMAALDKLRAEKIERMSPADRRLLKVAPY